MIYYRNTSITVQCLEVKGFLKISPDNRLVDLLCSDDPVPIQLSDVLQELKVKYPDFALPSKVQEDQRNKRQEDALNSDEDYQTTFKFVFSVKTNLDILQRSMINYFFSNKNCWT